MSGCRTTVKWRKLAKFSVSGANNPQCKNILTQIPYRPLFRRPLFRRILPMWRYLEPAEERAGGRKGRRKKGQGTW